MTIDMQMHVEEGWVYVALRSGTGRRWRVDRLVREGRNRYDNFWRLTPVGDDVRAARSGKTGKWQGGVRSITRMENELLTRFRRVE